MTNEKFSFKFVTEDLGKEETMILAGSKATPIGDISVDILKSAVDIHLPFITNSMNSSIEKGCFAEELTLLEVSPIFKTKDGLDKESKGLPVIYRTSQKSLKESCINK